MTKTRPVKGKQVPGDDKCGKERESEKEKEKEPRINDQMTKDYTGFAHSPLFALPFAFSV